MAQTEQSDLRAEWPGAFATDAWTQQARKELIGRIVRSRSFAKSERLSSMLMHICDRALKGREHELNEQSIGQAVFGRKVDYDSSIDGIVRTQASRLRQRLDLYFSEEGIQEPIRIEIPRGGYIPLFRPVPIAVAVADPAQPDPEVNEPRVPLSDDVQRKKINLELLPWIICACFALACLGLVIHRPPPVAAVAPFHPVWSLLFPQGSGATLVVPADSGLVISYSFSHQAVTLNEYLAGRYRIVQTNQSTANGTGQGEASLANDLASRRYTSIVDLEIAASLEKIAAAQRGSVQIRYARDLRPNDLKTGNALLIGAAEANPWVELFEPKMNFIFHNAYGQKVYSVLNRAPRPGEPNHWDSAFDDPMRRVFGVVALLPNLSGNGHVLLVEGTSMAGTEAAWDFVTDDAKLLPLLKQLQRRDGTLPAFEVLVGTRNMEASAGHGDVLAWRTHE